MERGSSSSSAESQGATAGEAVFTYWLTEESTVASNDLRYGHVTGAVAWLDHCYTPNLNLFNRH